MKPATRKSARKAMRVATVFTGAAAAAVTFMPAAQAGTGHTAGTEGKTLAPGAGVRANGIKPDYSKSGNIESNGACTNAEWVHLEWGKGVTDCFGNRGWIRYGQDLAISHECGGTNFGVLDNTNGAISFVPGTGYRGFAAGTENSLIWITGWSGTDHCGAFPAG
jgi:hypothetical protein